MFPVQPFSLHIVKTLSTVEEELSTLAVKSMLWVKLSRLVSYLVPPTNLYPLSDM